MGEIERMPANVVDQRLLQNAARMSPAELSASIGGIMTPAQVAAHVKKLLADRDWLTEAELDHLVTQKLQRIIGKLEGQFEDNENLELQLKLLKEIGSRLDARRKATQFDLNTYSVNVGNEMARVYDIALSYMRGALRDEIDLDAWDTAVDEALAIAQNEVMKKAVGE